MKSRITPQRGLELIYVGRLLVLGGLALVWSLTLSNQLAYAQVVSGSMVGNVTDAAGGSVPGASVKITSADTGASQTLANPERVLRDMREIEQVRLWVRFRH